MLLKRDGLVPLTVKLLVWTLAAVREEERPGLPGNQTQDLAGQRQGELSSQAEKNEGVNNECVKVVIHLDVPTRSSSD